MAQVPTLPRPGVSHLADSSQQAGRPGVGTSENPAEAGGKERWDSGNGRSGRPMFLLLR